MSTTSAKSPISGVTRERGGYYKHTISKSENKFVSIWNKKKGEIEIPINGFKVKSFDSKK